MHDLKSLLYWENPIHTQMVFIPPLVASLMLTYYSLISVFAWCCLFLLLSVLGVKGMSVVCDKLGKPNPLGDPVGMINSLKTEIPAECVQGGISQAVEKANVALAKFKKAVLMEDIMETAKFAGLCYFLTYIGSWFNALTLFIMVWIVAFVAPKVYLNNQAKCDEMIAKVMPHIKMVQERIAALSGNKEPEKQD